MATRGVSTGRKQQVSRPVRFVLPAPGQGTAGRKIVHSGSPVVIRKKS